MAKQMKQILEFLQKMIDDAESRVTGKASILDYGMRVRRETAEEIFRHVQSLADAKSAARTSPSARPAIAPCTGMGIELGLRDGPSAGVASTGADTEVHTPHLQSKRTAVMGHRAI
jgi:hypothetical protein